MSVKKVIEIIGRRQSGRTSKLKELWFESLELNQKAPHVFIGTDIRAKETINHVWDLDHFMKVYVISPLGDLVKIYNRHKVVSLPRAEGIDRLQKERDVIVFIDNITLNRTQETVEEVCSNMDVSEVCYTGLRSHFGKSRKLLKTVFDIEDLGGIELEKYHLFKGDEDEKI